MTGYRFRLEPTLAQERQLTETCRATRWLWNEMLRYRNDVWLAAKSAGATGVAGSLGYIHLSSVLTQLKGERPWLESISNTALRGALKNLDRAFAGFFGGASAYPVFKHRGERESINYNEPTQITVEHDWVKLPKLGWLRFRMHRPVIGSVRTATVSFDHGHWFISFAAEGLFILRNKAAEPVGIDVGIAQSVTLSSGEAIQYPRASAKEERRLRFFQRQAARRRKGSRRRQRSLDRVARIRARLANRRKDATHKLTTRLATSHRGIAIEDLRLKNMTRSARGTAAEPGRNVAAKAGLNRALLANAHGDFRRMLAYKCERSGATLVAVNPAHTSQTCSRCGHCAPENRESQAVFVCVACGLQLNADHNAALNILAVGSTVMAQGGSEITPARELRTRPKARRASAVQPAGKTKLCVTP